MKLAKRAVWTLMLAAMLVAFGGASFLWHEGYRVYAVRTGSMSPTYPTGTLIVDAPPRAGGPTAGEVVTFMTPAGPVTHRVYTRSAGGLTMKGDANNAPDPWPVEPEHVVGLVSMAFAGGGYVLVFLQQPTGVPSLVLLAMSIMFARAIFFPAASVERYLPRHQLAH